MRRPRVVVTALVSLTVMASCSGSSSSTNAGGGASSSGTSTSSGASGGGGGASSSGSSSGSSGSAGSSSGVVVTPGDGGGSCLGASMLSALGRKEMIVGGAMQAATAKLAPFDLQYVYISGGLPDGTGPCASCATGCTTNGTTCANSGPGCAWWGCWQSDQDTPGDYVRGFAATCAGETPPQIPMITYYQLLQSSGVTEGAPEVTQAATNATFMARYFADWRFLLQQLPSTPVLLHVEPDFWGYAEQNASDPTTEAAAVATANSIDCGSLPNTIAGMGQCMIAMVRTYAPKAMVALHASAWSTKVDVSLNTSTSLDVAGEARKTAAFLAACGESGADFVVVETSDRDAGYYQTVEGKQTWWDATNVTLPDFHQDFAWVQALTEALGKPALYWQTPLGNSAQNNTANHYQDNRVDYFFGHMSELAGAHAVGAAFGAGEADQTQPETDGNNFVDKANAYYAAGGQGLCP